MAQNLNWIIHSDSLLAIEENIKRFGEICDRIRKRGFVVSEDLDEVKHLFGDKAAKALELVSSARVKKYRFLPSDVVKWVVVGREREYLVLSSASYCSCDDFYYSFMKGEKPICAHILAQRLADATGDYREFVEDDEDFEKLIEKA